MSPNPLAVPLAEAVNVAVTTLRLHQATSLEWPEPAIILATVCIGSCPLAIWRYKCHHAVVQSDQLLRSKILVSTLLVLFQLGIWAAGNVFSLDNAAALPADSNFLGLSAAVCLAFTLYFEHLYTERSSAWVAVWLIVSSVNDWFFTIDSYGQSGYSTITAFAVSRAIAKLILLILEEMSKDIYATANILTPESTRGMVSRSISWLNGMVIFGFGRTPSTQSISCIRTVQLQATLKKSLSSADDQRQTMFLKAIQKVLLYSGAVVLIPRLLLMVLLLAQPLYISNMVQCLNGAVSFSHEAHSERGAFFMVALLIYVGIAVTRAAYSHTLGKFTKLLRCTLASEVCRKTFSLVFQDAQDGRPLPLLNTDVEGIVNSVESVFDMIASPVEFGVCIYLLASIIGWTSLLILLPSFVSSLAGWGIGSKLLITGRSWTQATANRVAKTSAMLSQLKAVRITGIDGVFSRFLQKLYKSELQRAMTARTWTIGMILTGIVSQNMSVPIILAGALFWSTSSSPLSTHDAHTVFAIVTLIEEPIERLLRGYHNIPSMFEHWKRIENYILQGEANVSVSGAILQAPNDMDLVIKNEAELGSTEQVVKMANVTITNHGNDAHILTNLNISVNHGDVIMVVGPTGCGKSTLLRTVIGDSKVKAGTRIVKSGAIGYCDQVAWLFSASIRDNIVGDSSFDAVWYGTVLAACDLSRDLQSQPQHDLTLIANQGANLSSGQKQRICLARAVYSRSPIIVLDEIFSSLDRTTACEIFDRLLGRNGLLRQLRSTVVMVTKSNDFLKSSDHVVVIEADGSSTMQQYTDNYTLQNRLPNLGCSDDAFAQRAEISAEEKRNNKTVPSPSQPDSDVYSDFQAACKLQLFYWSSFPTWSLALFFVCTVLSSFTETFPYEFVRLWINVIPDDTSIYFGYMVFSILGCLFTGSTLSLWFFKLVPESAMKLHALVLETLCGSTFTFTSSADSASTLALLSQDITAIPQSLALDSMRVFYGFCNFVFMAGMATSTIPYSGVVIVLLVAVILLIQFFHTRTSREVETLQAASNAYLQTHLSETVVGLRHIRSFRWHSSRFGKTLELLDASQRALSYRQDLQAWLRLVMDLVNVLPVALLVWSSMSSPTSDSAIGVSLLLLMTLSSKSCEVVQFWTKFTTSLNSLTRLQKFVETTPMESEPKASEAVTPQDSEKFGRIMMQNVSVWHGRRDASAPVFSGSFTVPPGSKIGIEGRTGCGKSSFILSLLNFIEFSGRITIDDVDITKIPKHVLRTQVITTLSPDIIEFDESVRFNLCPWTMSVSPDEGNVHDIAPIELLKELGLWGLVALHGGLDAKMADLGLSQGQKQLMCIARACLHKLSTGSRLVLMDNVTSGLDSEAEEAARNAMAVAFDDCTVFMVSHVPEHLENCNYMLRFKDGVMRMRSQEPRFKPPPPQLPDSFIHPNLEHRPELDDLMALILSGERLAKQQIAERGL